MDEECLVPLSFEPPEMEHKSEDPCPLYFEYAQPTAITYYNEITRHENI